MPTTSARWGYAINSLRQVIYLIEFAPRTGWRRTRWRWLVGDQPVCDLVAMAFLSCLQVILRNFAEILGAICGRPIWFKHGEMTEGECCYWSEVKASMPPP
jgi:hypothetical protein